VGSRSTASGCATPASSWSGFERTEDSARRGVYGLDYADVRGELEEGTKVAFDEKVWEGDPLSARGIFPSRGELSLRAGTHAGLAGRGAWRHLGDVVHATR
jgi:hypothetical protein